MDSRAEQGNSITGECDMATKRQIAQAMISAIDEAASNALNMKTPTLEDMYEHALGVKLGEATKAQMHKERLEANARFDAIINSMVGAARNLPQEIAQAIQATQSGNGSTPNTVINEKLDMLLDRKAKALKKQIKGGKIGAKVAKERSGKDSQRAEIYSHVQVKIDRGEKTDAAFAQVAQLYKKKPSAIKANYYREKNAREEETRGKHNRTGKKRGPYKTIGHAKN